MNASSIPYKITALAPFAPVPDEKFKPEFVDADLYLLDEAVEKISPVLYLPLSADLCSEGAVTLKFKSMKDFKPKSILKNNPYLASLSGKKGEAVSSFKKNKPAKPSEKEKTRIDDILSMVATSDSSTEKPSGIPMQNGQTNRHEADLDLGQKCPTGKIEKSTSIHGAFHINTQVSSLLKEIYSNAEFQRTEAAWKGLQILVKKARIKGFNKINLKIAAVSRNSLKDVLDEIESLPHDEIPNLVLIDLGFDNALPSLELMEKIVKFTDKMMVPACVSIIPEFFRIDDFNQLRKIPYISNFLGDVSYAKFRKIKTLPGAERLMVNCNSFAARPANEFEKQPLLVSPVWAMGTLCAMSINHSGWPMGFTRYNTNRIKDLAMVDEDEKTTSATEILLSEDRIMQLVEAGITPVAGMKNKDVAFIPREAALKGESIKFQLFINRIIEVLIHLKEGEISCDNVAEDIESAIVHVFMDIGHNSPDDIQVIKSNNALQDQTIFNISFSPPESVISGFGKVEFSFAW